MMLLGLVLLILAAAVWLSYNPRIPIYSQARMRTKKRLIALTFDDGPDPERTELVLRVLRQQGIKATFFVVGKNAHRYPELLRHIKTEGHLLGNHSYRHGYSALWPGRAARELRATDNSIYAATGLRPALYRPPFGFRTPWSSRMITKAGYKIVTWDNMTYDYFGMSKEGVTKTIVKRACPGGVIVLHDGHEGFGFRKSHMVEALPEIIRQLKEAGYQFVRMDELFDVEGYRRSK